MGLKRQFEESKNTLRSQLTTIHHKRLEEFALKLQENTLKTEEKKSDDQETELINCNDENHQINNAEHTRPSQLMQQTEQQCDPVVLETTTHVNDINIPKKEELLQNEALTENLSNITKEQGVMTPQVHSVIPVTPLNHPAVNVETNEMESPEDGNGDDNELHVTLKEVSSLLEQCWKKEMNKQQRQRVEKGKEIVTLKEILSVYQNLSRLVQIQSDTLKTTILDFENLCDEKRYVDRSAMNTTLSSPDRKRGLPGDCHIYQPVNTQNTQIQLLTSSEMVQKHPYHHEEYVPLKSSNSARKKRRKSWGKKSTKNSCKTPAFSFDYNRATVSSQKKNIKKSNAIKKKCKRTKSKKSD